MTKKYPFSSIPCQLSNRVTKLLYTLSIEKQWKSIFHHQLPSTFFMFFNPMAYAKLTAPQKRKWLLSEPAGFCNPMMSEARYTPVFAKLATGRRMAYSTDSASVSSLVKVQEVLTWSLSNYNSWNRQLSRLLSEGNGLKDPSDRPCSSYIYNLEKTCRSSMNFLLVMGIENELMDFIWFSICSRCL